MSQRIRFVSRLLALIGGVSVVVGLLGVVVAYWAYATDHQPGPLHAARLILIPKGASIDGVALLLARAGAVRKPGLFRWVTRAHMLLKGKPIQAGEYKIPRAATPSGIRALLQSGKVHQRFITIPEGLTSARVHRIVAEIGALVGSPGPIPAEGSLLPETYAYRWGDSRIGLLGRMSNAMTDKLAEMVALHGIFSPLRSVQDVLVLASIVEKESGHSPERPVIAGVFLNRLRRNMLLQSDPTVIYALIGGQGELGRKLTRGDMGVNSRYNTYRYRGIPPGPIANPGEAAISAVLKPKSTDYLYFVTNGRGAHRFARTFRGHRSNIARWRKEQRGKKKK